MPLTDLLSERLKIPVFIENDTKAMAYGEYASKERSGYENVIYVNVGWGLGLCLIVNGEIYYGKDGYSGEFGHVHMYNNNIMCHCGKKGCIETELSGSAICRKLIERIHTTRRRSFRARSGAATLLRSPTSSPPPSRRIRCASNSSRRSAASWVTSWPDSSIC